MAKIHPTAVIERGAVLADDVEIGAFAVIGFEVELGPQVEVGAHASVLGKVRIAARTRVYPHAALGGEPQDREPRGCGLAPNGSAALVAVLNAYSGVQDTQIIGDFGDRSDR